MTFLEKKSRGPVETNVQQSDCEPAYLPTTSKVEELNGPVESDVQQYICNLEIPLNEHSILILILDLQTDSVYDKIHVNWSPFMGEQILMVVRHGLPTNCSRSGSSVAHRRKRATIQL